MSDRESAFKEEFSSIDIPPLYLLSHQVIKLTVFIYFTLPNMGEKVPVTQWQQLEVIKFELKSRYLVFFWTNTPGKDEFPYLSNYKLNSIAAILLVRVCIWP